MIISSQNSKLKHWTVIVFQIQNILDANIMNQTDFVMILVEIIETLRLIKSAIFSATLIP